MKRVLFSILLIFTWGVSAYGQVGQATEIRNNPSPPANCNNNRGWVYWDTTLQSLQVCSALNSWSPLGAGGSAALAGNSASIYASPACGQPSSGNCFFVNANGKYVPDATTTNNSSTITCPNSDCNFVAGDVGKIVFATNLTVTSTPPFTANVICPQSTIQTVNSAQSITLAAANDCTSSVAGAATLIWGADDTTNLQAAWTAVTAVCGTLQLPMGRMLIQAAVFLNAPAACTSKSFNSTRQIAIIGQGYRGSSEIVPTPNFNFATCTGPDTTGAACFGWGSLSTPANGGMYLSNWVINGYGQSNPTTSSVDILWTGSDVLVDKLVMANWGSNDTHMVAIHEQGFNAIFNAIVVDGAGCGSARLFNGVNVPGQFVVDTTGITNVEGVQIQGGSYIGDSSCSAVAVNGNATYGPHFKSVNNIYGPSNGSSQSVLQCTGGGAQVFDSENDLIFVPQAGTGASYYNHGCIMRINHASMSLTYVPANGAFGIYADAGTTYVRDSQITSTGNTSPSMQVASGGTVYSLGGNNYSGSTASLTVSSGGTYIQGGPDVFAGTLTFSGTQTFQASGFPTFTFATLPTATNGSQVFCSDCTATCGAGASNGAMCFRANSAWAH